MARQPFQMRTMPLFELLKGSGVALKQVEAGVGRGAAQRIGREAVAVPEGQAGVVTDEGFEHRFAGHGHAHRQTSPRQAFGQGHQIRPDARPPAGEPVAAASEAGEHFIGDQQGSRLAGACLHLPQKLWPHHGHAPGPLQQRFEDHRRCRCLQHALEHLECRRFLGLHGIVVPPGGRPGNPGDGKKLVFEWGAEQVAFANGHRSEGVAVISPVEGDDLIARLAPVGPPLAGDLERHFHRRGAVVGEEQPLQAAEAAQAYGQLFRRLMGEVGKNHLLEAGGLIGDGLGQHRMGMAVQGDPPAADGIDQGLALLTDQQGTVSRHHPLGVGCAGHLGEGGPKIRMADRPHGSSGSFCHIESGAVGDAPDGCPTHPSSIQAFCSHHAA